MREVSVGIIGLGNVGTGTLGILLENADQIALKLGFDLRVKALCSSSILGKQLPSQAASIFQTADWRQVVADPEVDVVAELVGGTGVAREIIEAAIANRKWVVTANKELMARSATLPCARMPRRCSGRRTSKLVGPHWMIMWPFDPKFSRDDDCPSALR
jgi:homoserine dehydrogenase